MNRAVLRQEPGKENWKEGLVYMLPARTRLLQPFPSQAGVGGIQASLYRLLSLLALALPAGQENGSKVPSRRLQGLKFFARRTERPSGRPGAGWGRVRSRADPGAAAALYPEQSWGLEAGTRRFQSPWGRPLPRAPSFPEGPVALGFWAQRGCPLARGLVPAPARVASRPARPAP